MIDKFEWMFDTNPGEYISPHEKVGHQEIDCSDELDDVGIKINQ
jgi:hypothetical protein